MSLPKEVDDWCDNIDAAIFTGNLLGTTEAIESFEYYLERWNNMVVASKTDIEEMKKNESK